MTDEQAIRETLAEGIANAANFYAYHWYTDTSDNLGGAILDHERVRDALAALDRMVARIAELEKRRVYSYAESERLEPWRDKYPSLGLHFHPIGCECNDCYCLRPTPSKTS